MSRYSDLDRPPLSAPSLTAALAEDGFDLIVLQETASTNADLVERAHEGAGEGTVVVAEWQKSGHGRMGRTWESPPRAGLTFSVLLRPQEVSGWLPLIAGLAVAAAVTEQAGIQAGVKWPNDILITEPGNPAEGRKIGGILSQVAERPDGGHQSGVVIGVGLNVTTRQEELPFELASSLALAGARTTDRETLLKAILRSLARGYASWRSDPSALIPTYRSACVSLGRRVRVQLPGGESYEGVARDVDEQGRLVVDDRAFAAGDVIHLR